MFLDVPEIQFIEKTFLLKLCLMITLSIYDFLSFLMTGTETLLVSP